MRRTSDTTDAVVGLTPGSVDLTLPGTQTATVLRVLVVDGRRAMAEAIAFKLGLEDDIGSVAVATTWPDVLAEVEVLRPHVVIADLDQDDVGLRVLRHVQGRRPPVHTVVLTDSPTWAVAAVRAGARGIFSTYEPADRLAPVVRGIMRGETHIHPRLLTSVIRELTFPEPSEWEVRIGRLTKRERDVIGLMVAGHSTRSIAEELYLSVNTVRTHVKNILAKLEVHSSLEAVSVALRAGIRSPGGGAADVA